MRYGLEGAKWAPMTSDTTSDAMPVYGDTVDYGNINESNDTLNFAEANAYGDNARKIALREFTDGTISTKAVNMSPSMISDILGTANDGESGASYSGEDTAPYGGYGFYTNMMDAEANRYYEVVFYPKVQGYVEGSNYKTKEDSITLDYDALSFNIFQAECGIYKTTKRFNTKAAAIEYLDGLFDGSSAVPGIGGESTASIKPTEDEVEY